jgi:hypothetical protein
MVIIVNIKNPRSIEDEQAEDIVSKIHILNTEQQRFQIG